MTWFLTIAIYKGTVNDPTTFRPRKGRTSPTTGPCSVFSPWASPRRYHLRDLQIALAASRWHARHRFCCLQPYLECIFLQYPSLICLLIQLVEFSLTLSYDYFYMRKFPTLGPLFTLDVVLGATCRRSGCVRLQHE